MSSNCITKLVGTNPKTRGDLDYIDTKAYRCEAVVDWFAFRIETVAPTQFRYIQAHLAERIGSKPHIEPIDADTGKRKHDEGGTSTVFDFKVYDGIANNCEELLGLFDYLATKFALAGVPTVTGVEIALDAYSRRGNEDDLRKMTLWMMQHLNAPNENVRQYDPSLRTKKKNILFNQESRTLALNPELNLRMGNRGAGLSFQVYWKRTDKTGGDDDLCPAKPLPRDQWRARAEFTLLGDRLAEEGVHSTNDLATFDLASLAKHLWFGNPITLAEATAGVDLTRATAIRAVWDDRAVCLNPIGRNRRNTGTDGYRKHTSPKPLKYSRYVTPNKVFNRIVTNAFANLGTRYLAKRNNENDQKPAPTPPEAA